MWSTCVWEYTSCVIGSFVTVATGLGDFASKRFRRVKHDDALTSRDKGRLVDTVGDDEHPGFHFLHEVALRGIDRQCPRLHRRRHWHVTRRVHGLLRLDGPEQRESKRERRTRGDFAMIHHVRFSCVTYPRRAVRPAAGW
jgi:hypothetical protein